jgi:hypothetical protein
MSGLVTFLVLVGVVVLAIGVAMLLLDDAPWF